MGIVYKLEIPPIEYVESDEAGGCITITDTRDGSRLVLNTDKVCGAMFAIMLQVLKSRKVVP